MEKTKAERLLEFLRQKEKEIPDEFNLQEFFKLAKTVKIEDKDIFVDKFARALVLMTFGVEHENLNFAKDKFYDRVGRFCRQGIKVAVIINKHHEK
ncbi:hypothetical protein COS77_01670 [Candidatus Roizmanbacteria bacterium CG06_land_8_20_14_3_00_34_14]|uniref:Uncharacterized protein n=2 Tax=Microgenomates group TaxID=1794810 RepID=A0A2M7AUW5_9BACT|nr:MAG: hypothetical protein COX09_02535 [Candidatus Beckwithbacteria bacterium CG23_combo_of_CG06-09_8_20_14_all_47_9]PIU74417.1 MAG: hypothetical protein COS77_01670 [Candidatus Roizmanbacteria bacterium CG06_land_8_20_14_3_00_34_14]